MCCVLSSQVCVGSVNRTGVLASVNRTGVLAGERAIMLLAWLAVFLAVTGQPSTVTDALPLHKTPCYDWQSSIVIEGDKYRPDKRDPCLECTCNEGKPSTCTSLLCLPPSCKFYEQIDGECCKFHCPNPADHPKTKMNNSTVRLPPINNPPILGPDETTNLGLRLVASTVTSFLILALLLFMIHRLRRRRMLLMMQRMYDGNLPHHRRHDRNAEVVAAAYVSEYDDDFDGLGPYEEPPPPYSPPRPPRFTPRDAPPPYETLPSSNSGDLNTLSLNNTMSQRISNASIALVNGTLTFRVSANHIDHARTQANQRQIDAPPPDLIVNENIGDDADENEAARFESPTRVTSGERERLCQREYVPGNPRLDVERPRQRDDVTHDYENHLPLSRLSRDGGALPRDVGAISRDGGALSRDVGGPSRVEARDVTHYVESSDLRRSLTECDDDVLRAVNTERLFSQFSCTDSEDSDGTFRRDSHTLPRRAYRDRVPRSSTRIEFGCSDDLRKQGSYVRHDDLEAHAVRDSPRASSCNEDDFEIDQCDILPECSRVDECSRPGAGGRYAVHYTCRRPCYRNVQVTPIVLEETDARKVVWRSPERTHENESATAQTQVYEGRFRVKNFNSDKPSANSRYSAYEHLSPVRNVHRRSFPPMSLHLDDEVSGLEVESFRFSPTSPDIYPGAKQFQSPITPVRDSSTYEGSVTKLTISPGTPVQPFHPIPTPLLIRSNSLGSQLSCVSVCSETGEKRKRGHRKQDVQLASPTQAKRKYPSTGSVALANNMLGIPHCESNVSICSCPGDYSCSGDIDSEDISSIPASRSFGGAKPKVARRKTRKTNMLRKHNMSAHAKNLNVSLPNTGDSVDNTQHLLNSMDDNGNFEPLAGEKKSLTYTQYGFIDIPACSVATAPDNELVRIRQKLPKLASFDDAALDGRFRVPRNSPDARKKSRSWRKKARQTVSFDRTDFPSPISINACYESLAPGQTASVDFKLGEDLMFETSI